MTGPTSVKIVKFDAYKLRYYSAYGTSSPEALIRCYHETTEVGLIEVGRIEFYKAETMEHSSIAADGQPVVRYRIDRFPAVHQILLHEKPLTLYADNEGLGAVRTHVEPTGEEEPEGVDLPAHIGF